MALLHKATIVPSKLELLAGWLPTRSWFPGPAGAAPSRVAAARLDDPAGEVGVEILIIEAGQLLQVPLTYRGAPLAGAEEWLVGTTEHSVLGTRWVYDAVGDPVYAAGITEVIRTAGQEAAEEVEADGKRVRREPDLALRGSGADAPPLGEIVSIADGAHAVISGATHDLTVFRVLGPVPRGADVTGAWNGDASPAVLATLTPR